MYGFHKINRVSSHPPPFFLKKFPALLITFYRHQELNEHPLMRKHGNSHITNFYVVDLICWMRLNAKLWNRIQPLNIVLSYLVK